MTEICGRVADATTGEGLGGVAVTNGEHVAETAADGGFALPVEEGEHTFAWVTVPSGWQAAGNSFYRRFRDLRAGEGNLEFWLTPAPERCAPAFRLAQITDLHVVVEPERLTSAATLRESLARLDSEASPDFVVASGDLTNRGALAELRSLRQALASTSCPLFPLFAGHDGNEERHETGEAGGTLTRHWEEVLGPTYYSFDWGGRHFALYPTEEGYFSAADRRRKRAWLEADLARQPAGRQCTVIVHSPPTTAFIEELGRRGVSLILYGHWHSAKSFRHAGVAVAALPPLCFGGIDTSPRSYRLVDFADGGAPALALRCLGLPDLDPRTPQLTGFERVWEAAVPGGVHRAAPVEAPGGRLLVSLRDEDLAGWGGVLCLDASTGGERWRVGTDASVKNRVALAGQDRAVALAVTGQLCAFDLADGRPMWETRLPGHPERWLFTAPVAAGGVVYAGGKAGYGAYSAATGEERWYTPLESSDNWSCYAGAHLAGDLLVCLVQRRGLVGLDRRTGEITWELAVGVEYLYGDPVLEGDVLFSGGEGGELVALRAGDGEVLWQRDLGAGYPAGLAADSEGLYVSTPDGQVQRRSRADGELVWSARTGADLLDLTPYRRGISSMLAAPVRVGEMVAVGANDGCLYLLDAGTGKLRARGAFGVPLTAAVTRLEDGFCAGTLDGRLVRYRWT